MTVTSIHLTLWCVVIGTVHAINWTKVKPMHMVAMFSVNGQPTVFNLESEAIRMEMLPGGAAAMERIFGGTVAAPKNFPYQVGMMLQRIEGLYWCGGSLISDEYVLTAAHCVDRARRALVFLGAHEIRNMKEKGQLRMEVKEESFLIHPEWNARRLMNDIALVRLPDPVKFSDQIQPIALPKRSFEYKDLSEKLAIASGWGRYATGVHALSNALRYVKLKIIDGGTCSRSFPLTYRSTNICTSGGEAKSTCQGDSGGPLVVRKRKSQMRVLVGITSFGSVFGCDRGYPAAYTKVVSYLDWILDETGIDTEDRSSAEESDVDEDDDGQMVGVPKGYTFLYG